MAGRKRKSNGFKTYSETVRALREVTETCDVEFTAPIQDEQEEVDLGFEEGIADSRGNWPSMEDYPDEYDQLMTDVNGPVLDTSVTEAAEISRDQLGSS